MDAFKHAREEAIPSADGISDGMLTTFFDKTTNSFMYFSSSHPYTGYILNPLGGWACHTLVLTPLDNLPHLLFHHYNICFKIMLYLYELPNVVL